MTFKGWYATNLTYQPTNQPTKNVGIKKYIKIY